MLGKIEALNPNETFSTYLERFNFYVEANDIPTDKRKSVFLSVVGTQTFKLIKDLIQPSTINKVSLDEITQKLQDHLEPKASIIVYRYKLDKYERGQSQTIGDFITQLKHLAENCKFGDVLNERLRDKLVSSVNDDQMVQ